MDNTHRENCAEKILNLETTIKDLNTQLKNSEKTNDENHNIIDHYNDKFKEQERKSEK